MGQRSHMLPKLSCLSNQHCQSVNLAPHAIEEWDNESLFLPVSQCVGYVYRVISITVKTKESIFILQQSYEWHLFTIEGIFSSMTELIVPSYLNCRHSGESAAAHYQALLSDSPWGLCLQHCLAFKHTYICQVLSSVPVSNSYKLLHR